MFQEDDNLRLDILDELLSRIDEGRCCYSRLLPGDADGVTSSIHWAGLLIANRQKNRLWQLLNLFLQEFLNIVGIHFHVIRQIKTMRCSWYDFQLCMFIMRHGFF